MGETFTFIDDPSPFHGDDETKDWLGVVAAVSDEHMMKLASLLIPETTRIAQKNEEQLEIALCRLIDGGILHQLRKRWLPRIPEEATFEDIAEAYLKLVCFPDQHGWKRILPRTDDKKPTKPYVKVRSNREGKRGPYKGRDVGPKEGESGPRHVSTCARSSITDDCSIAAASRACSRESAKSVSATTAIVLSIKNKIEVGERMVSRQWRSVGRDVCTSYVGILVKNFRGLGTIRMDDRIYRNNPRYFG